MGLTRKDLEGELTREEFKGTDEEFAAHKADYDSRRFWIARTQSNDQWANKIFSKVGILITSHQANRLFLKPSIDSHAKLGFWITLAYDNYVDPTWETIDHNTYMPAKDVLDKVDLFLTPHHQVWGGCLYSFSWLLWWGAAAMQRFEYIYCANGDFVLEKPEGFPQLFELMGDADIMTSGPDRDEPPAANTAGFIVKSSALMAITKHIFDHLVPWENYEKYTQSIGNMEGRFGKAIQDLGLKQKRVSPPLEDMFRQPGNGTWAELLGFRHIHAELNHAYRNRGIPPPLKYMDERFAAPHDLKYIKLYEETGDPKVLEEWYAV